MITLSCLCRIRSLTYVFLNKFYIIIHPYCVWFIVQNSWYEDLNTHCILHALSILNIIIAPPTLLSPIFRKTTTHNQFIAWYHKLIMNRLRSRTGSPVLFKALTSTSERCRSEPQLHLIDMLWLLSLLLYECHWAWTHHESLRWNPVFQIYFLLLSYLQVNDPSPNSNCSLGVHNSQIIVVSPDKKVSFRGVRSSTQERLKVWDKKHRFPSVSLGVNLRRFTPTSIHHFLNLCVLLFNRYMWSYI